MSNHERQKPMRFPLGRCVITPGAQAALEAGQRSPLELIRRHQANDWGDICPEDKGLNEQALHEGMRLLSVYHIGKKVFWIITEADRSCTTILLPEEY